MRNNYLKDYRKPAMESDDTPATPETTDAPVVNKDEVEGSPTATSQPGSDSTAPKDVPEVTKEAPTEGGTGEIVSSDEGKTAEGEATGKEAPVEGEAGDIVPTGEGEIKAEGGEGGKTATADAPSGEIVPTEEGKIEITTPKVDVDVTEVEFQITSDAVAQVEVEVKEKQEVEAAKEVLEGYADTLRHLLATETYTITTGRILEQAISNQLRNCNVADTRISLEGHNAPLTVKGRHESMLDTVVMEGNILNSIAQTYVVNFKRAFRAYADHFRTFGGMIKKYNAKLASAEQELASKRAKFGPGKHQVSLAGVAPIFSTKEGRVKDLNAALVNDLKLSKYILVDYQTTLTQLCGKLTSILNGSNLSTLEGVSRFATAIEALPHPVDLFKKEFIQGKSYLCSMSLDIDAGKTRAPIDFNGKSLEKLANLATPKKVVESIALIDKVKDQLSGGSSVGAIHEEAKGNGVVGMTTDELGKFLTLAKEYLKLAQHNLDKVYDFEEHAGDQVFGAFNKLDKTITPETKKLADKVMAQVLSFAWALLIDNFNKPSVEEIKRVTKIANNCEILARRVISNAGKGAVSSAKADTAPKAAVTAAPKAPVPPKK